MADGHSVISSSAGRPGDPCVMVIFGASGDLTRRKLIPALYNLATQNMLPRQFAVIGVARQPFSTDEMRKKVTEEFKEFATGKIDPELWDWFVQRMYYVNGDFDDAATYQRLKDALAKVDKEHSTQGNCFFYLATAPEYFGEIVEQLATVGLMTE